MSNYDGCGWVAPSKWSNWPLQFLIPLRDKQVQCQELDLGLVLSIFFLCVCVVVVVICFCFKKIKFKHLIKGWYWIFSDSVIHNYFLSKINSSPSYTHTPCLDMLISWRSYKALWYVWDIQQHGAEGTKSHLEVLFAFAELLFGHSVANMGCN